MEERNALVSEHTGIPPASKLKEVADRSGKLNIHQVVALMMDRAMGGSYRCYVRTDPEVVLSLKESGYSVEKTSTENEYRVSWERIVADGNTEESTK